MFIFRWCIKIWGPPKRGIRSRDPSYKPRDLRPAGFFSTPQNAFFKIFVWGKNHFTYEEILLHHWCERPETRVFFHYFRRAWGETPRRRGNAKLTARNSTMFWPFWPSRMTFGVSNMEGLHELLDMVVASFFQEDQNHEIRGNHIIQTFFCFNNGHTAWQIQAFFIHKFSWPGSKSMIFTCWLLRQSEVVWVAWGCNWRPLRTSKLHTVWGTWVGAWTTDVEKGRGCWMANKPKRYGKLVIYIYILIYTVHMKKLVNFITNSHVYLCLYI